MNRDDIYHGGRLWGVLENLRLKDVRRFLSRGPEYTGKIPKYSRWMRFYTHPHDLCINAEYPQFTEFNFFPPCKCEDGEIVFRENGQVRVYSDALKQFFEDPTVEEARKTAVFRMESTPPYLRDSIYYLDKSAVIRAWDRIVSRFGGDYPVFVPVEEKGGECRPKDTSEVAESNEQDGDLHGGDGASGETKNPNPSSEGSEPSKTSEDSEPSETSEDSETSEGSEDSETSQEEEKRHGGGFGGEFAHWTGKHNNPKQAKEAAKALSKLFATITRSQTGEQTPRILPKKLAKEIVSKRFSLSKCRREEMERGIIVVMCDVSGSCSTTSPVLLQGIEAIYNEDDRVAVVIHSNGEVLQFIAPRSRKDLQKFEISAKNDSDGFYQSLFKTEILGAVNFGDNDAERVFSTLAAITKLVLFDSYAARSGVRPASSRLQNAAKEWEGQPLAWVQGVNSVEKAVIGLRLAKKIVKSS